MADLEYTMTGTFVVDGELKIIGWTKLEQSAGAGMVRLSSVRNHEQRNANWRWIDVDGVRGLGRIKVLCCARGGAGELAGFRQCGTEALRAVLSDGEVPWIERSAARQAEFAELKKKSAKKLAAWAGDW